MTNIKQTACMLSLNAWMNKAPWSEWLAEWTLEPVSVAYGESESDLTLRLCDWNFV